MEVGKYEGMDYEQLRGMLYENSLEWSELCHERAKLNKRASLIQENRAAIMKALVATGEGYWIPDVAGGDL